MSSRCGNCKFALAAFPDPGPAPVRPEMPKGFWKRLFFDHDRAYWDWRFEKARHLDAVRCHRELVRCHRHPEAITKRREDFCGEHRP